MTCMAHQDVQSTSIDHARCHGLLKHHCNMHMLWHGTSKVSSQLDIPVNDMVAFRMIKLLTLLVAMCALAAPRAGFAASDTLPAAVDNASAIGLAADVPLTVLGAMRQLLHSKRGGKRHSHHKVTKSKKLRNKKAKGKKTVKKSVKGKKKASTKQASKKVNSKKNASKKQASKKNSGKKQASKKQSGGKKPSVLTPAVTAMAKDIRFIGDWNQNEGGKNYNGPFELPEGMVVQTTLPCELTEVRAEISQDQNDQKFVTLTVTNTYESVAECGFPVNASIVHCAVRFTALRHRLAQSAAMPVSTMCACEDFLPNAYPAMLLMPVHTSYVRYAALTSAESRHVHVDAYGVCSGSFQVTQTALRSLRRSTLAAAPSNSAVL